jgi:hypothetical protein
MYNPANGSEPEQVLSDVDEGAGVGCSGADPRGSILRSPSSPTANISDPKVNWMPRDGTSCRKFKVSWSSRTDLEYFPFLARLCRRRVVRYVEYDREKRDDARSISRINTVGFKLVQVIS